MLGKHPHVVRYYSAWAEDDYMYIQNEYCNGKFTAAVDFKKLKNIENLNRNGNTIIK